MTTVVVVVVSHRRGGGGARKKEERANQDCTLADDGDVVRSRGSLSLPSRGELFWHSPRRHSSPSARRATLRHVPFLSTTAERLKVLPVRGDRPRFAVTLWYFDADELDAAAGPASDRPDPSGGRPDGGEVGT
jgi:hypothetical protein